jgi:hypothetical protein
MFVFFLLLWFFSSLQSSELLSSFGEKNEKKNIVTRSFCWEKKSEIGEVREVTKID